MRYQLQGQAKSRGQAAFNLAFGARFMLGISGTFRSLESTTYRKNIGIHIFPNGDNLGVDSLMVGFGKCSPSSTTLQRFIPCGVVFFLNDNVYWYDLSSGPLILDCLQIFRRNIDVLQQHCSAIECANNEFEVIVEKFRHLFLNDTPTHSSHFTSLLPLLRRQRHSVDMGHRQVAPSHLLLELCLP